MREQTKKMPAWIGFVCAMAQVANAQPAGSTSTGCGWVTVSPPEFHGAINWHGSAGKQYWPADLHSYGPKDQFPWQATYVYRDIWKHALIEGEVEYNWQQQRDSAKPEATFGRTPDETMKVPARQIHPFPRHARQAGRHGAEPPVRHGEFLPRRMASTGIYRCRHRAARGRVAEHRVRQPGPE
jgi:hypothetical protein